MYHKVRRKMRFIVISAIFILSYSTVTLGKSIDINVQEDTTQLDDNFDNNIIDFDEEYSVKLNKKYDVPWHDDKNSLKYTLVKQNEERIKTLEVNSLDERSNKDKKPRITLPETTTVVEGILPLELASTTENPSIKLWESTTEEDLTVIPISTTVQTTTVEIKQSVTLPASTQSTELTETTSQQSEMTTEINIETKKTDANTEATNVKSTTENIDIEKELNFTVIPSSTSASIESTTFDDELKINDKVNQNTTSIETRDLSNKSETDGSSEEVNVPIFTELDTEEYQEVPEDYYDSKDVMPTSAPKTDALSVLFGFAGSVVESVVESVAERVVPKGIIDLFKRMQRQNEALEAERLRSREENGGLGQFGRGILKTISTGLSKPFIQIMDGVRDRGSLDSDRGFVSSIASGVTSVVNTASTAVEQFKDRVQAIYPGTVWCGGGHAASARAGELGFFFFTDTCCRQHDACKIYIESGHTKYGLTNTGLFTRSHCSCDIKFRECLRRTNSLVSSQIGLTYFNVLGPQCFRKAHPIVKCVRRTRITGQKCEEYELDYTKPKMWQWFDNEFF